MTHAPDLRHAARTPAVVLGALLLGACAAGPTYRGPPSVDTGHGWSQPADAVQPAPKLAAWWTALGDPTLDRLVGTALSDNLDLRQAEARIREARALRDRAAGGRRQWQRDPARPERKRPAADRLHSGDATQPDDP